MITETAVIRAAEAGLSAYCVLTALQALVDYERYTATGVLNWEVARLQFNKQWQQVTSDILFRGSRSRWLLVAHLLGGMSLGFQAATNTSSVIPASLVIVTTLLMGVRHHAGFNGTYHLSLVVALAVLWGRATQNPVSVKVAIAFVGLQSVLAYALSGWLKLGNADWRDGDVLTRLSESEIWIADSAATILARSPASKTVIAWSILTFECLFPVVLFLPKSAAVAVLLSGFLFHFINAVFLGLNTFLFIFVATYPAIYYLNRVIHTTVF